ncbi:MAG TPA: hypothetical protein VF070_02485, partial [Streptosporangiaceae bacterium]
YAADNPVTNSDPTGMLTCNQWGECYISTTSVKTVHVTPPSLGGPQYQTPIQPLPPYRGGGNTGGGQAGPSETSHATAATNEPACSRATALSGMPCHDAVSPGGGGFNPFGWASHHWRGILQIGIAVASGVGAFTCMASVVCGVAGVVVIGSISGFASYEVSGGGHTWRGALGATLLGAGSGLLSALGGSAFSFAAGREIMLGMGLSISARSTESAVGVGVLGGLGATYVSGLYAALQYMHTTSPAQRSNNGVLISIGEGVLNTLPLPLPKIFGQDNG